MSAAKRVLAATDKSIAWLADPAHRDEAIELLVKVAPFEQGGCRGELRLPPPDRIFRADQQDLAHQIAQSGGDGAARRNRRRGVRHRAAGHAGPDRTHRLKRGTAMKFPRREFLRLGSRRPGRPCPAPGRHSRKSTSLADARGAADRRLPAGRRRGLGRAHRRRPGCRRSGASRSSSRTRAAPAATSPMTPPPMPRPTATRCCSARRRCRSCRCSTRR